MLGVDAVADLERSEPADAAARDVESASGAAAVQNRRQTGVIAEKGDTRAGQFDLVFVIGARGHQDADGNIGGVGPGRGRGDGVPGIGPGSSVAGAGGVEVDVHGEGVAGVGGVGSEVVFLVVAEPVSVGIADSAVVQVELPVIGRIEGVIDFPAVGTAVAVGVGVEEVDQAVAAAVIDIVAP